MKIIRYIINFVVAYIKRIHQDVNLLKWNNFMIFIGALLILFLIFRLKILSGAVVVEETGLKEKIVFGKTEVVVFVGLKVYLMTMVFFSTLLLTANAVHFPKKSWLYFFKVTCNLPVIFFMLLLFFRDFSLVLIVFFNLSLGFVDDFFYYLLDKTNSFLLPVSILIAGLCNFFYLNGFGYKPPST